MDMDMDMDVFTYALRRFTACLYTFVRAGAHGVTLNQ